MLNMKKTIYSTLILSAIALLAFSPGKKKGLINGNDDFLKKPVTIYVELDISKSSIDGLDTEAGFIEYKMKKKSKSKKPGAAKKWEAGWKKDKAAFAENYVATLQRKLKKLPATFNLDDPSSDYKMVIEPMHIQTGTPIKYSSFETKLKFYKSGSDEEVAVHYYPGVRGLQMGPMSPTSGMRVSYSMLQSATMFIKNYKKKMK